MKPNLWPREPDSSTSGPASSIHALLERETVEHGDTFFCVHDLEGRLLFTNPAPAQLLGYSVEELLRIPMRELVVPEFRAEFDAYLHRIRQAGEDHGHLAVLTRSGEHRIWQYHNRLHTEATPFAVVSGRALDVTEQKRLESSLKASEARLRTLLEQTSDGIFLADSQGRYLDVNPAGAAMLGYTREEILQRGIADSVVPEEVPRVQPEITSLLSGCSVRAEWRFRRKDGSTFPGEVAARALPDGRLQGILRDLSDRQQSEETLRANEKRLASLVSSAMDAIISVDEEQRITLFNAAAEKVFGCPAAEAMGQPIERFIPERFRRAHAEHVQKFAQTGTSGRSMTALGELCALRADGREFPMEASISRIEANGRKILTVILRDVTERKRAEENIAGAFRYTQKILDTSPVGIITYKASGEAVAANLVSAQQVGASIEQLKAQNFRHIESWRRSGLLALAEEALACDMPRCGEIRATSTFGKELWVNAHLVPFTYRDEPHLLALFEDIAERKKTEQALKQTETKFRTLFETANDAFLISSGDEFLDCNLQAETLFRCRREDIVGHSPLDFSPSAQPDGRLSSETIPEKIHAAMSGRPQVFEWKHVRRDGTAFDAEVSLNRLVTPEATPCLMGSIRDITERKRAQEILLRSEERYRALVQASAQIVWTATPDGDLRGESMPEWQRFTGQTTEEMSGRGWLNAIHPEDRQKTIEVWERAVAACHATEFENRLRRHDGVYRYMLVRAVPVRDSAGNLVEWVGTHTDITEKKQVEEEQRRTGEKLREEKIYLEKEIRSVIDGELVGQSQALQQVMKLVAEVAPSNATVLLLGETGTGKELVARAVHRISLRKNQSFIKMNCAAIPSGLLESELFGHEKGAFTGAVSKKLGRLELADRGTLFLDEIGEIPLELQPKLLRVLQDQEFERLGSTQTIKVNFRLIAATNRDLAHSVKNKQFRSDLYYRINIFPIRIPPLRERREDIPLLVEHFVKKFAAKMNKTITSIPAKTMETLLRWKWPGNVRELENFVERSVILTRGEILEAPLHELLAWTTEVAEETLEAAERRHILLALRDSRGQLSGPWGAAARLGLPRTTLQSKLKQLGIDPRQFRVSGVNR